MAFLFLAIGLVLLVAGADALVRGASNVAGALGISPLVVGLTVVAFGTSAPEVAVSVGSALAGQADLALGNVVGSNIFNVLFILGLAALIAPLTVSSQLVRADVPLGLGVAFGTLLLALDGTISRGEGAMLVGGMIAYTGAVVWHTRRGGKPNEPHDDPEQSGASAGRVRWGITNLAFVVGGLALLVLGARWMVDSAVTIAQRLGVSDLVIGLTVVAGGTSLPELATSVLAGLRGERDIAVGNVVGSNLFNLLAVLGLSALVSPIGLPVSEAVLWFDLPVMIAVAFACLPIFLTGGTISRWEGALFLGYYGAYTTYLLLAATQHDALSTMNVVMGAFVLPITILTLLVVSVQAWRSPSASSS